jgi:hypothetical protein
LHDLFGVPISDQPDAKDEPAQSFETKGSMRASEGKTASVNGKTLRERFAMKLKFAAPIPGVGMAALCLKISYSQL